MTVEELACILADAPIGDLGRAYWLLKHDRVGPLLLPPENAPTPPGVTYHIPLLPSERLAQGAPVWDVRYCWEVRDVKEDCVVAGGDTPTQVDAEREGRHYLSNYSEDGPCLLRVWAERTLIQIASTKRTTPTQPTASSHL